MTVPGAMHAGMLTESMPGNAVRLPYLIPRRLQKKYVCIFPEGTAKTSRTLVSFCAIRNARFRMSLYTPSFCRERESQALKIFTIDFFIFIISIEIERCRIKNKI